MTVVVTAPDGRLVQEIVFVLPKFNGTSNSIVNCKVRRVCFQNTGQRWEWVSPPMKLGGIDADGNPINEYRTTERYLGKPVYVKVVDFGALPNASTRDVKHKISNIDYIVSATGTAKNTTDGWTFNFPSSPRLPYVSALMVSTESIVASTSVDWSKYNLYVTIKYTKTTD